MQPPLQAFVVTASEVFKFYGPVYEFSYCSGSAEPESDWPSQWAAAEPDASLDQPDTELDRLEKLERLPFPAAAARTVLCIDALQHVFEPRQAVEELLRILAPGGMLFLASTLEPSRLEHPDQYWRLTPRAIERLLAGLEATLLGWQGPDDSPHTVFGLGFKPPVPAEFLDVSNQFLDRFQARTAAAGQVGWRARLRRLATLARGRWAWRRLRDHSKTQFVVHAPVDAGQLKPRLLAGCLPRRVER